MSYDIWVRNTNWEMVAILDAYSSLVWTDNRLEPGDFDLQLIYDSDLWDILTPGTYLEIADSEHVMRILRRELSQAIDSPLMMTFTGSSMEGILAQRVVNWQADWRAYPGDILNYALDNFAIGTGDSGRNLPLYRDQSRWVQELGNSTIEVQYLGEDLLTITTDLLKSYAKGTAFLHVSRDGGRWRFRLRSGRDRSWEQDGYDWVTFSSEFDNLRGSKYSIDTEDHVTHVYVKATRSEDNDTIDDIRLVKRLGTFDGLNRRETFETSSITDNEGQGNGHISLDAFHRKMDAYGQTVISAHGNDETVTGEVDFRHGVRYGVDYAIGDLVNIVDDVGHGAVCSIDSVTITNDADGLTIEPRFGVQKLV